LNTYIGTSVFRHHLGLFVMAMKLPELVNLTVDGVNREFTVLHKIELCDYPVDGKVAASGLIEPKLNITSWAVVSADSAEANQSKLELIDPERDWAINGFFWVGATQRIYRDRETNVIGDKRWGGLGWCGNAERDLIFPTFRLIDHGPLFTTTALLSSLNMLATPGKVTAPAAKPAVFVGVIDEVGALISHVESPAIAVATLPGMTSYGVTGVVNHARNGNYPQDKTNGASSEQVVIGRNGADDMRQTTPVSSIATVDDVDAGATSITKNLINAVKGGFSGFRTNKAPAV
jgi:hypothetical protein